ncbi:sugar-specific transcriptional regulator TrmB [Methanolobus sediminis]|uniref:Sugar-specific transcriptional regulator TrmB n=1 Tax=Methanolobus sediminis TaxID=3072978 RepID=A0AA51YJ20_9EURY|nr:sugar-specific transcriptional regulator TrmB [Methanolobus sediminis]WMW25136.1 sugar-specific transcriptional regulator TrmB [Methanolobus sediminis]
MRCQIAINTDTNDHVRWILSVDRRIVLLEYMKKNIVGKASDVAQVTRRSTQNMSRAMKEFEGRGLIECINPAKNTWKKYILTDMGRNVIREMDGKFI